MRDVLLWLCTTPGVGGVTVRKLQDYFGAWERIWAAEEAEMVQGAGIGRRQAKALLQARDSFDPAQVRRQFEPAGIRFVTVLDPDYPEALHELYDPPAGLFAAGKLSLSHAESLAVVGSRQPTSYGRLITKQIVSECAGQGLTIVSGLARGIDTVAHHAALDSGGRTVAVLGSGLLQIYPRENEALARRIVDSGGAVLSEWHPLTPGKPGHFPVRNRLISGLCQGTLVVEAGECSGSLITADSALEQGRDVYAIPGPINSPQSVGTNRLIQQGAKAVLGAGDVLEDYGRLGMTAPAGSTDTLAEDALFLLNALGVSEAHVDELLVRTGWELGRLHKWLLRLQTAGKIGALPGGKYIRIAK